MINDNFALNLPFNATSFGGISFSIAREIYSRGLNPNIFPIGGIQLDAQKPDEKFTAWLQTNINKSLKTHNRKHPCFKLWHANADSLPSVSDNESFLTFIETDSITEYERNILAQKKNVFVTSNYLKGVCEEFGLNNVKYLELGFDSFNFYRKEKRYFQDDRVVINLLGKWEHRKHHRKVIRAFLRKYPNNPKVFLQASVYNQFLKHQEGNQIIDDNERHIAEALENKRYFNLNFLPWSVNNEIYNDVLNSAGMIIGMGGGENFGAGEFHSVGMGKHACVLNANGFKDWATPENSTLVSVNSKVPSADGRFFHAGHIYQQGNFFSFDDDEFISKLEETIKKCQSNPINTKGLELQNRTYKQTVDTILESL